jgi:penicillin-binding protein 2
MARRKIFSSMFARRVALLYAGAFLGMATVSAQLVRLTVVEGGSRLVDAERPLVRERWTETKRGRILDRNGEVLAEDRPSFDVLVDYSMITGVWAIEKAAGDARKAAGDEWATLSQSERDARIEAASPARLAQMERMWSALSELTGAPRTDIERTRARIIANVQRTATTVWEKRRRAREIEWAKEKETAREVPLAEVARPIREQREAHTILRNIDDESAFALRKLGEEFPELRVVDGGARSYPWEGATVRIDRSTLPSPLRSAEPIDVQVEGVATHLLGWMRDRVLAEDIERRPRIDPTTGEVDRGHYREGDAVGAAGIERAQEGALRGLRGVVLYHRDTGEEEVTPSISGRDVQLTVDINLQSRVQALLDPAVGLTVVQRWHENPDVPLETELAAGAIVLDIESGDILAAGTWPTFTRTMLEEGDPIIFEDPVTPAWVDRSMERPYAPASIVKPLVYCEAVRVGAATVGERIECNGHFLENRKDVLRCWIYRERFQFQTHSQILRGPLAAHQAIARSCNIFFYTMGSRLGPEGMHEMYRRLGVLRGFDIGIGGTANGQIGRAGAMGIDNSEAIMMAMGQGPVTWTPLHAVAAYGALARSGIHIEPRLLLDVEQSGERVTDLQWERGAVEQALRGLEESLHESWGTGNHIFVDDAMETIFSVGHLRIAGKTGTGQASPTMFDPDGDGPEEARVARRGDHAWTVVLAGPRGGAFEYAVAVVVEHGGSGGRVAGPIVNQILEAMIAEGHLPKREATP